MNPIPTRSLSREVRRVYKKLQGKEKRDRALVLVLGKRLGSFTPEVYNAVGKRAFK